jgi:hypothetical protein
MFITERQNYDSSTLFLLAARSTLAEMVQISDSKAKTDLIEYIHNDASDFEVMGLLMTGKLPPVKHSVLGEKLLFSNLKEQVLKNFGSLTQVIGENVLNSFLQEVDSVFPRLSTQKPVLEFFAAVREQGSTMTDAEKARKDQSTLSQAHEKENAPVSDEFTGKELGGPSEKRFATSPEGSFKAEGPGIMHHIKNMADDALAKGSDVASKIVSYVQANPMAAGGVGAAALAALIAYAGYQVYKKFFSKAAKACANQSGPAKEQCLAGFRKKAVVAQAQTLMKASAACSKSKDPRKCKAVIMAKVAKVKAKM